MLNRNVKLKWRDTSQNHVASCITWENEDGMEDYHELFTDKKA